MTCATDIVCFADAGTKVGSGHIYRVYPVLQALLQKKVRAQMTAPLGTRKSPHMELGNTVSGSASSFATKLARAPARAVLLDSYRHRAKIFAAAAGCPVLLFDDHFHPPRQVTAIVNASPSATPRDYDGLQTALLGPKYASLHRAFRRARAQFCVRGSIRRILVALGGSDTAGNLPTVVSRLLEIFPDAHLIVCGAPGADVAAHSRVLRKEWLSQPDVADCMAGCDLAVLAGGQMLVQAACIGLPAVAWPQSSNQSLHAGAWAEIGSVVVVDEVQGLDAVGALLRSRGCRSRMSLAGRVTVDGLGASRIASTLLEMANAHH